MPATDSLDCAVPYPLWILPAPCVLVCPPYALPTSGFPFFFVILFCHRWFGCYTLPAHCIATPCLISFLPYHLQHYLQFPFTTLFCHAIPHPVPCCCCTYIVCILLPYLGTYPLYRMVIALHLSHLGIAFCTVPLFIFWVLCPSLYCIVCSVIYY